MSNEDLQKVPPAVTVLAGARDGYNLPIALAQSEKLARLVTDFYWPGDTRILEALAGNFSSLRVLEKRFDPRLPSGLVTVPVSSYMYNALARTPLKSAIIDRRLAGVLSEKARREAIDRECPLFAYSYYAFKAFQSGQERPEHRFIFQLHPHPESVRRILRDEIQRTPMAAASLLSEYELSLPELQYQELREEPHLANGWVVASSYSAETLAHHGIPRNQIHVIPYGVDSGRFPARNSERPFSGKFTVIFVGSMMQRKGLSDLLDAVRLIASRNIRVILCGRGMIDKTLLQQYNDLEIEVNVGLPIREVVEKLHGSDVFVFPSLIEGFGHVVLEAMSSGLPVITTDHTCGPDIISESEQGFIVPIRAPSQIAARLEWSLNNRSTLREMGEQAAQRARVFTWERFHEGIRVAYRAMYQGQN